MSVVAALSQAAPRRPLSGHLRFARREPAATSSWGVSRRWRRERESPVGTGDLECAEIARRVWFVIAAAGHAASARPSSPG